MESDGKGKIRERGLAQERRGVALLLIRPRRRSKLISASAGPNLGGNKVAVDKGGRDEGPEAASPWVKGQRQD
jgi:hypothetical protein